MHVHSDTPVYMCSPASTWVYTENWGFSPVFPGVVQAYVSVCFTLFHLRCGRSNIVVSYSPYDIGNMLYLFQQTIFCPMLWPNLKPEPELTCTTAVSLKQDTTTIPLAESSRILLLLVECTYCRA